MDLSEDYVEQIMVIYEYCISNYPVGFPLAMIFLFGAASAHSFYEIKKYEKVGERLRELLERYFLIGGFLLVIHFVVIFFLNLLVI